MADRQGRSYTPLGVSGLPRYSGYVFDEWLPELQGPRGRKVLREMADNSPVIGALKFAMEMMIRQAAWTIEPGTDDEPGQADAQFVHEALHDMEVTFEDTLADILTMIDYGWSLFEVVFKRRREGESKYSDGKIGWKGWEMRGQETLLKWEYEDAHAMLPNAFVQQGPPDFLPHEIPMDRCLLFRTTTRRGNPEGRSFWRNAYSSWYMAKHLEAIEAIGAERDMAGLPVGKVPSNILSGEGTKEEQQMAQDWRDLVTNIRRDEQEGVLIPSDVDDNGNPMFQLTLLSTGGQRQFNLGEVVARHEQRMLVTCLGDFILLASTNAGAQTLGKTKIELFSTAISAILAQVAAQINDKAIPALLKLNGRTPEHMPHLRHGDIERMDLDTLGNFLYQLGQAGFTLDTDPQGALMKHLMQQSHLPQPPKDLEPNPLVQPGVAPGMAGIVDPNAQPNKKRGSLKVPNQPNAPKGEPPHVAKGPIQAKGKLAKASKASRRQASESLFGSIAKQFSDDPMGLHAVAFDLDGTAGAHPDQLVPLANYLKASGVQVGVMSGNVQEGAVKEMWNGLGYPEPDFAYLIPEAETPKKAAQWKAEACYTYDVQILIDDFCGGKGAKSFVKKTRKLGATTLALQVPDC